MKSDDIDRIIEGMSTDKNSLRKAAEMALEGLETLWDILDDIDTASDMAKENDAWYRKRVEALQKKRWDTMITTDGYKLKGGPVEALRQALAHEALDEMVAENQRLGLYDDAVNMTQECVDKTAKDRHISYVCPNCYWSLDRLSKPDQEPDDEIYDIWVEQGTCQQNRQVAKSATTEWVGLTDEEILKLWGSYFPRAMEFYQAIEAKLKEKNT